VFRNFGKVLAEFFGYQRFGAEFIDTHIDIIGLEHLDGGLAAGKGVIINTAHLANFEIGAAAFARRGYKMVAVAQMHPEADVNELFRRQRASRGYDVVPPEGAFRQCIRGLQQNKIVLFVGERNIGEGGIEVNFMGRPSLFPQGPARIALAAGAPLIPGFVIRRPNDSFAMVMLPPLRVPETRDKREAARLMTQAYADIVAGYIRMFPAQWGVFFRAWDDTLPLSAEDEEAAQRPVWGRGTRGSRPPARPPAAPASGRAGESS
jgi:KDO2-lipid IV(A) lauroyltransferase